MLQRYVQFSTTDVQRFRHRGWTESDLHTISPIETVRLSSPYTYLVSEVSMQQSWAHNRRVKAIHLGGQPPLAFPLLSCGQIGNAVTLQEIDHRQIFQTDISNGAANSSYHPLQSCYHLKVHSTVGPAVSITNRLEH